VKKDSKLVGTYFRNGLKSNLDLTTLADTKAGILISVNGFILTVIMTASGFVVHNNIMNFAFASIILTALVSIILAAFAIRPRTKEKLLKKDEQIENYSSLLYYDDMAKMHPANFIEETAETISSFDSSARDLTLHLHILGAEIKKKYFWLRQAYTYFSIGLIISVFLAIYGLIFIEQTPFNTISTGTVAYQKEEFENIFEPSGAIQLPDGKILIVEDEAKKSFSLLRVAENGEIVEDGKLPMSKDFKHILKKEVDDLEAITIDRNIVYAITSHSNTKKDLDKERRNQILKFEYVNGEAKNLIAFSGLKEALYEKFPNLFRNEINIEGLAFNPITKTLNLGFRTPLNSDKAVILEIKNPENIFNGKLEFGKLTFLDLNGLGIRDFTYDKERKGYWIVAGSSGDRGKKDFELWFLNDNGKAEYVKNQPKIGFTEGITQIIGNKTKLLLVEDNGKKPNNPANYIIIDKDDL
jgi:hypothetical protein